ncbi:sigma factor-like helix-turn-helix DNA-binding protein [Candidatus Neomarinimicrobiota bacterium]
MNNFYEPSQIIIPDYLKKVPFERILLFRKWVRDLNPRKYKRLLVSFKHIGEIDRLKIEQLYKVPGLGRTSISTLQKWLKQYHSGKFESLIQNYKNLDSAPVKSLVCSSELINFLLKNGIKNINDIWKLDELDFIASDDPDKLALLELRTLGIDKNTHRLTTGANFPSNSMTMIEAIDNFLIHDCHPVQSDILVSRWTSFREISLSEIAHEQGLTTERIRQRIESAIEAYKKKLYTE